VPIKRCSHRRAALLLLTAALAAGPVWPQAAGRPSPFPEEASGSGRQILLDDFRSYPLFDLETMLIKAREARRNGDYVLSLELVFEVLLYHPADSQARSLLKEVAGQAAELEIQRVQAERKRIREQAQANYRLWLETAARHESWKKRLQGYAQDHAFLEAYEFLYQLDENYPQDPWPKRELQNLALIVIRDKESIALKDQRYQDTLWGFYFYADESWPKARQSWLAALSGSGSWIPEGRIRAYLKKIEPLAKLPLPRPPSGSVSVVAAALHPPGVEPPTGAAAAGASREIARGPLFAHAAPAGAMRSRATPKPAGPSPEQIEAWYAEALRAYQSADADLALSLLDKVLRHSPGHEAARKERETIVQEQAHEHYLSGLIHYGRGELREAIREWQKALAAKPDHEKSRRALEYAQKEMEEPLR